MREVIKEYTDGINKNNLIDIIQKDEIISGGTMYKYFDEYVAGLDMIKFKKVGNRIICFPTIQFKGKSVKI